MKISLAQLAAISAILSQTDAFFCLIRPLFKPIPLFTIPINSGGGGGGGGGGSTIGPATSCAKPACAKKSCPPPQCLPLPDPEIQGAHIESCKFNGFNGGLFLDNGSPSFCY
ncbi:hypothetical protein B0T11DRAFT_329446 [Plectosphaerella cucumerina]|uniref:Uncharacterized protein n=1 Tax=Plectosphaerella cucumerina TaxID=40658 RepID=A0A8K0TJW1_9PEZI|nr:hypothetical protein B0T11DRAFT_329446 [Plectosphaerella cucumerina]